MDLGFMDIFLWVVFPYVCLTIFVVGNIYRYNVDQFGWTAKSSQLLENQRLKWGSILFHWGIIFAFFGHVMGILIPKEWFDAIGVTEGIYHVVAVYFGAAAGIVALLGGILLWMRRISVKRIRIHSSKSDIIALVSLVVVILLGVTFTFMNAPHDNTFNYREYIGPWFRGLLIFQPMPHLMVNVPPIMVAHIFLAFVIFAIWPFTRLVHVWSVPLTYLNRRYVVYRKMSPPKVVNKK